MLRLARLLLPVVIVAVGCGSRLGPAGGTPPGTGVVRGTVLAWPCAPVESTGTPCAGRPAADVEVTFTRAGRPPTTVRSDVDGKYQVVLAAGSYTVSVPRNRPIRSGAAVTVVAGLEVNMDIVYDSGLRLPGAPSTA